MILTGPVWTWPPPRDPQDAFPGEELARTLTQENGFLGPYPRTAMVLSSCRTLSTKPGWSVARKDADCAATPRK
jgi:hypothetical protein